jgi:hypothetical protein
MGTNFYRIQTEAEIKERHERLVKRIAEMDLSVLAISQGFSIDNPDSWDRVSPWDEFTQETEIHLGKRSMGWKFCWNFHKNKYYSDKESLDAFVRSGRIIDEYGEEHSPEEFLKMAYDWGQPDGWVLNDEYERTQGGHRWGPSYYDLEIDGLRVSTATEFS